ncbi:unnamed protein product [Echinostoma caproni]|uniref:Uncharacterized protein n=1 Tax=Echinostoma caproni TaxID=27848 RepID=A0A183A010_9TREM|nr:unnamed protein product [Echinostoma caproni]
MLNNIYTHLGSRMRSFVILYQHLGSIGFVTYPPPRPARKLFGSYCEETGAAAGQTLAPPGLVSTGEVNVTA